ncbi:hypothetical protein VR46_17920 [Streptomyces sp. NRRL S-444]|nr:hypothetical protein VR46_17920 [Streptomyces sp. NRRL S-444]
MLPYGGQDVRAQQQARPSADQDALRPEQVDDVRQARAQVLRGLLQDLQGRRIRRDRRRQQGRQGFLLVHRLARAPAPLRPACQQ